MPRQLSPRLLRRLLDYNPKTGEFKWRERPAWMFKPHHKTGLRSSHAKTWNKRFAGTNAFTSPNRHGYLATTVMFQRLSAHRTAFAIIHDRWPDVVDHINGDPSDNRIENLREVSHVENLRNTKLHKHNTTGHMGVRWHKRTKRWVAFIKVNGKQIHLGSFGTFDEAVSARQAGERRFGFHTNHGRIAA